MFQWGCAILQFRFFHTFTNFFFFLNIYSELIFMYGMR